MNRGLLTYLKEGSRTSKMTFSNNKLNYFKFYLWVIASCIGKIFIITYPAFAILDVKVARKINEEQSIEILESFDKSDNKNIFLTTLLCFLYRMIIFIAGLIIILLIIAIMAGLGYIIGIQAKSDNLSLILAIALGLPGLVIEVIFIINYILYFSPSNYIITRKDDYNVSKVLFNSAENMKKDGKKTLFMISFIPFIIMLVLITICFVACYLCISSGSLTINIIGYALVLLSVVFLLFVNARLSIIKYVAKIRLFDDIIIFDIQKEKIVKEEKQKDDVVKDKKKKKIIETRSKEEILISLFNDKNMNEEIHSDEINNDEKSEEENKEEVKKTEKKK